MAEAIMQDNIMKNMVKIMGIAVLGSVVVSLTGQATALPVTYTCPTCGETFTSYDSWYNHMINDHPGEYVAVFDLNGDDKIDNADLAILMVYYGAAVNPDDAISVRCDFNRDGYVNALDMSLFLQHMNLTRDPIPTPGQPSWQVDNIGPWNTWFGSLSRITWPQIFREEYVAPVSLGTVGRDDPLVADCGPYSWTPPYAQQLKAVCRTGGTWLAEPFRYNTYHITGIYAPEAIWQAEFTQYFQGLDDAAVRTYLKALIPTVVPLAFIFLPLSENACDLDELIKMFTELDETGYADVTNIYQHPYAVTRNVYMRVIIFSFDGFVNTIRKYDWFSMVGGLALR